MPAVKSKSRKEAWFGPQPRGCRKVARPFAAGRTMEACFKLSPGRATWRLDRSANRAVIRRILASEAKRSRVRVQKVTIEAANLRVELRAVARADLALFLRALGGRIPRAVAGAEKGRPLPTRFWSGLVATRILPSASKTRRIAD